MNDAQPTTLINSFEIEIEIKILIKGQVMNSFLRNTEAFSQLKRCLIKMSFLCGTINHHRLVVIAEYSQDQVIWHLIYTHHQSKGGRCPTEKIQMEFYQMIL